MNYYPQVKTIKSYDKNTGGNLYTLVTNIRFKHKDGFYYLVIYKIQYSGTEIDLRYMLGTPDESLSEKIWNKLWQKLVLGVEDLKNNHKYNPNDKVTNPIDPYQGEISNYKPEIRFDYYDPNLSYGELMELNKYMKDFK